MNNVLDFINRRFKQDCNWTDGNCYYFSIILKNRFPEGSIWYDVIDGHFCLKIDEIYYDWKGVYIPTHPIQWDKFDEYDNLRKNRIIRDCLM